MSEATGEARRASPGRAAYLKAEAEATAAGMRGKGSFDARSGLFEWYEGVPIGAVVGENVRRLRENEVLTQHELVQRWRQVGLDWARSKLSALESGMRPSVTQTELLLMAAGLRVSVAELFAGPGRVVLAPTAVEVDRALMREIYSDRQITEADITPDSVAAAARERRTQEVPDELPMQADVELAQRLGVHPATVARSAMSLFDARTLTAERDRRVARMGDLPAAERAAHRGHITRELASQIEEHIASLSEAERMQGKWHRG